MAGLRQPGRSREIVSIGASYTATAHDMGKTFVVTAAATVTLPNPSTITPGSDIEFLNIADTDLTISCDEKIVAKNNAAADSVTFSTSGEKIGAAIRMICIGSLWFSCPITEELITVTVGTD